MENTPHVLKRIIACFMLVILAVPLGEMTGINLSLKSNAVSTVKTGYCGTVYNSDSEKPVFGKNAKFTLYRDGTLVISGTGEFGGFKHPEQDVYYIPYANYEYIDTFYDTETELPYDDYADITVKSVMINEGITSIGNYAFCDFAELESVSLPNSLKKIGEGSFSECPRITEIIIPENVTSIGKAAFSGCKQLMGMKLPPKIKKISAATFLNCSGIMEISIPDSVTSIEEGAFYNCTSLDHITIPDNVSKIGRLAFYGDLFVTITIPVSVTNIQEDAFLKCRYLEDVYYTGSKQQWKQTQIVRKGNDTLLNAKFHYKHKHEYTSTLLASATCCTDGQKSYHCICGDHYLQSIPATAKDKIRTTITSATTTKDGKIVSHCDVCKRVTSSIVIPKISSVTLSSVTYTYDGNTKTPKVIIKDRTGNVLIKNRDYTVSLPSSRKDIGQYSVKVTFKGNYSGSKTLTFNIVPPTTSKISVSQSTSAIKALWKAVANVTGYKVYLYKGSKLVKSVVTKNTSYKFTSLSAGTTYKVIVKAYKTVNGKNFWSESKSLTTATKPGTPTLSVTADTEKAALSWNKQTGATGYEVYMSTSKSGKYSKIATLKGNSKISYTKTGLTKGKTYYFKVAAYKTVDGKNIYGASSAVKSAKIK